jgi:DNA-binding transcriptional ArsR family regulator
MKDIQEEKSIILHTSDPALLKGFTQVPNFILRSKNLTDGAKVVYAMLLSYGWHNNCVFPGQERLADDTGKDERTVSRHLRELKDKGFVKTVRRGLGKTNVYELFFFVDKSKSDTTKMSGLN